jgi:hypothetical protein
MKINHQPLAGLSDATLRKDREYWTRALEPMIGDWLNYNTPLAAVTAFAEHAPKAPREDPYIHSDSAQKWASKLRSSIAGVYAWRSSKASDPAEKQRMLKEADFAFRQAFAVCPHSHEAIFRFVNLLLEQKRFGDAGLVAEAASKVAPGNQQIRSLLNDVRTLEASQPK